MKESCVAAFSRERMVVSDRSDQSDRSDRNACYEISVKIYKTPSSWRKVAKKV